MPKGPQYLPEGTVVEDVHGEQHTVQKYVGGMCTHYRTDLTPFLSSADIERVVRAKQVNSYWRHLIGVMLEEPQWLDEDTLQVCRQLRGTFLSGASEKGVA